MNKIVIKNMRQVQTISDVLHMERLRILSELIKTHLHIQNKFTTLKNIFLYQVNFNNQRFGKTASDPASTQILSEKLTLWMIFEEIEISKLWVIDRALSERIRNIDRKIQLMSMFELLVIARKISSDTN
ncbi:MAG: hypothetical protein V4501_03295 [Pseudomonadota bacterium]